MQNKEEEHPLFEALDKLYCDVYLMYLVHNRNEGCEGGTGRHIVERTLSIVRSIIDEDNPLVYRIARGTWRPKRWDGELLHSPEIEKAIFPVIAGWCPEDMVFKLLDAGACLFGFHLGLNYGPSLGSLSDRSFQRNAILSIVFNDNVSGLKAVFRLTDKKLEDLKYAFSTYEFLDINLLCYAQSGEMVKLLASLGVPVNPETHEGRAGNVRPIVYPLWTATRNGRLDLLNALIDCGGDVKKRVNGRNFLSIAITNAVRYPKNTGELLVEVVHKFLDREDITDTRIHVLLDPKIISFFGERYINRVVILLLSAGYQPLEEEYRECVNFGTYDMFLSLCAVLTRGGESSIISCFKSFTAVCFLVYTLVSVCCDNKRGKKEKDSMLDLIAHSMGGYEVILYFWTIYTGSLRKSLTPSSTISTISTSSRVSRESLEKEKVTLFDMLWSREVLADRLLEIRALKRL